MHTPPRRSRRPPSTGTSATNRCRSRPTGSCGAATTRVRWCVLLAASITPTADSRTGPVSQRPIRTSTSPRRSSVGSTDWSVSSIRARRPKILIRTTRRACLDHSRRRSTRWMPIKRSGAHSAILSWTGIWRSNAPSLTAIWRTCRTGSSGNTSDCSDRVVAQFGRYRRRRLQQLGEDLVHLGGVESVSRPGDRDARDDAALRTEDWRADRVEPNLEFLVCRRVAVGRDIAEDRPQPVRVGYRARRVRQDWPGDDVLDHHLGLVRKQNAADARAIRRRAQSDATVHPLHADCLDFADVDDFALDEDTQVDLLLKAPHQDLEVRHGNVGHIQPRQHGAAHLQQLATEAVLAVCRIALQDLSIGERVHDAESCSFAEADVPTELRDAHRLIGNQELIEDVDGAG